MICKLCPRNCGALRLPKEGNGVCQVGETPKVAKIMLHHFEEPCISGSRGSGTIFFSGCTLKCVFCQNYEISAENKGKYISVERLRDLMRELEEMGAHNINLVNPTHYAHSVAQALENPPGIPVVYNCGGYEGLDALKSLSGKVQIYLADLKYSDNDLALKYSGAPDYVQVAKEAVREMYNQVGDFAFDDEGNMTRGLIIRHLVLPGKIENSKDVIDFFVKEFKGKKVMLSLMGQYVPAGKVLFDERYKEINKKVSISQYKKLCEYMELCGVEYGYTQELSSADSKYTPDFICNI